MDNINSTILSEGYGLKLISSARTRTGLICKTDKGTKELRKVYGDDNLLMFNAAAKRHLKQRGFDGVRVSIPATDGSPFFNYDDQKYVLEDYYAAQSADLTDKTVLKKAVTVLAAMHTASEGFTFDGTVVYGPSLTDLYARREKELWRIMKRIKSSHSISAADRLVLDNGRIYAERAQYAVSILRNADYGRLYADAADKGFICHNAYKGDNIRLTNDDGKIAVEGFTKCTVDMGAVDLAEFIRRYYKDNKCGAETAADIADTYNAAKSLTTGDARVLYACLVYPGKFFRLCNKYYNKRRTFMSAAVEDKFRRCCQRAAEEQRFLNELSTYLLN